MPGTLIQRIKTIDMLIQKKNTGNAACRPLKSKHTKNDYELVSPPTRNL